MDRKLPFFSYEQCFESYQKRIESIRQHRIKGETIIAKPVLMVAIIDAIDSNVFTNNQFAINDWLEGHYKMLMSQYAKDSQFDGTTEIDKPFWHLESDGFWHLNYQGRNRNSFIWIIKSTRCCSRSSRNFRSCCCRII